MNPMGKENMGGQAPDSFPRNLLSLLAIGAQFFYFRAFGLSTAVAGHTQGRRRPPRYRALFRALMAASARQFEIQVSLVGKGNGLVDAAAHPTRRVSPGQYAQPDYRD